MLYYTYNKEPPKIVLVIIYIYIDKYIYIIL